MESKSTAEFVVGRDRELVCVGVEEVGVVAGPRGMLRGWPRGHHERELLSSGSGHGEEVGGRRVTWWWQKGGRRVRVRVWERGVALWVEEVQRGGWWLTSPRGLTRTDPWRCT